MTLREQILDDASTIHLQRDDFAEAASYWPLGVEADAVEIDVVVEQWQVQEPQGYEDGQGVTGMVSFYCAIADVPTVSPYKDTVTIREVTFKVTLLTEQDLALQRINGEAVTMTRKSRQGFERTR